MKFASRRGLTERLVDPYEIKDKIYMIGYCHLRGELRTFRINRIRDLIVTENTFVKH